MDLRALVREALAEDVGPGDLTTDSTVPEDRWGEARIVAKQDLVVCGHGPAQLVFAELAGRIGKSFTYAVLVPDGAMARKGDVICTLEGPLRVVLTGERLALNLLMKLSGIATNVRPYVDAAGPNGPRVVDTRKTTPLLRDLEKNAVRAGGGHNHRHALYDGVLIKDNHIVAAGGITKAVASARERAHHLVRIEVECAALPEVEEAMACGVDCLLLDNMDDATLKAAVALARGKNPKVILEASGNMSPERIARIKDFGLDLVSAGGLVHQARWVDLSLQVLG
jgi:nicotinate-nucleotide pyrophosphorylase (carboxylating)